MTTEATSVSGAAREPLRVAIEVEGLVQPAWIDRILSDIQHSEVAVIVLVVLLERNDAETRSIPSVRLDTTSTKLYSLYSRLDRRLFGSSSSTNSTPRIKARGETILQDACRLVDVAPRVLDVDRVQLPRGRAGVGPSAEVIAAMAGGRVDVTLHLGSGDSGRDVSAGAAPLGTLSFHHGAGSYAEGPPGFWEVMEREPVTTSSLQLRDKRTGHPVAVWQASSSTDHYSVTRNLDGHLWTCSAFVLRYLKVLHQGQASPPATLQREQPVLPYGGRRRGIPKNKEMLRLLVRHAARVAMDRIEHVRFPRRWVLAYSLGNEVRALHDFELLVPPEGYLWADPFPVLFEGRYTLFMEEQYSAGSPGHISTMSMRDDGSWTESTEVISAGYHLSYPCVFRWNDCFYMIPESGEARRIELYRCTDFPTGWELDRVLVDDIRGVDTTVAEVDGRWWMFVNTGEEGARNCEELSLFSAPAPIGPWVAHAGNPVNSDARSSRPAGHIVPWHGRLLRPSQDSGGRYGRAVVVNEILRLDAECFKEIEIFRIEADWNPSVERIHSFNSVDGLTVVDLLLREKRGRPQRRL